MRRRVVVGLSISLWAAGLCGADPTVAPVTHGQLQAVDADGVATYAATDKVVVTGIVLNNPEEFLNPTPGPDTGYMGGEWQIFIQGEGDDHAGTALYMGQYYAKVAGSGNYADQDWLQELFRINHDPNTGYMFAAGDRIKVTGWYKFYKGKLNINEKHNVEPFFDFRVELITPAAGLPEPELVTLDMVKDESDRFIFDPARLIGCEHYQSRLVRIDDVNIVDSDRWVPKGTITIRDCTGRTFPVRLGLGDGFTQYACPTAQIDVIGILDQETADYSPCRDGYRLCVPSYDGNGLVLTHRGHRAGSLLWETDMESQSPVTDEAGLHAY